VSAAAGGTVKGGGAVTCDEGRSERRRLALETLAPGRSLNRGATLTQAGRQR
jgi:hypothetical protein